MVGVLRHKQQSRILLLQKVQQPTPGEIKFGDFQLIDGSAIDGRYEIVDFFMSIWRNNGGMTQSIRRKDIKPSEMKRHLDRLVILDVVHVGSSWHLMVRLIGGYVANFYGEITGKDVREMENTQAIARIYQACARVLELKTPILTVSPAFAPERLFLEAIALYMPLFDEKGNVEKVLVYVNLTTQQ